MRTLSASVSRIFICSVVNTLFVCSLWAFRIPEANISDTAFSTIRDVIYDTDGKPFTGTISILPQSFGNINPPSLVTKIDDGMLLLRIVPTANAPADASYLVTFTPSNNTVRWTEIWHVPLSDHLTLKEVRPGETTDRQTSVGRSSSDRAVSIPIPVSEITGLSAALNQINSTLSTAAVTGSQLQQVFGSVQQTQLVGGEIPSGAINGSNATFTLSQTPTNNSLALWKGGLRLQNGVDYTLSGATITFSTNNIPKAGNVLNADYFFVASSGAASPSATGVARATVSLPLPISDVTGLASDLNQIDNLVQSINGGLSALSVIASALSSTVNVTGEVPTGTLSGTNATFILANQPASAPSVRLYRNGQRLSVGSDYSLSGATITFISEAIPRVGDMLMADYTATKK